MLVGAGAALFLCVGCGVFAVRAYRNSEDKESLKGDSGGFSWRSSFGRNSAPRPPKKAGSSSQRTSGFAKQRSSKQPEEFSWRASFGQDKRKMQEAQIHEMSMAQIYPNKQNM
jgi:hypothetical protein